MNRGNYPAHSLSYQSLNHPSLSLFLSIQYTTILNTHNSLQMCCQTNETMGGMEDRETI